MLIFALAVHELAAAHQAASGHGAGLAANVPNPVENSGVRNSCEAFAIELLAGAVKPGKLTPHLLPEARLMIRSLLPGTSRSR